MSLFKKCKQNLNVDLKGIGKYVKDNKKIYETNERK